MLYFTEAVACADAETCLKVCDNPVGCSNVAYPKLILGLAPTGKFFKTRPRKGTGA